MKQVLVLVFCVGATILSVNGDKFDRYNKYAKVDQFNKNVEVDQYNKYVVVDHYNKYVKIDKYMGEILNTTNNILIEYDENLDKTAPFKELKASLTALDKMAKDYHGSSQTAINSAFDMGHKATNNYFRATDTIYTWCVKAEVLINYMISNKPEKKLMVKSLIKLTGNGVEAVVETLKKLANVRSQLEEMSEKLSPVPNNLKQELTKQQKKEHSILKRMISTSIMSIIRDIALLILHFLEGPVGKALGLPSLLDKEGVPVEVIKGNKEPSEEQQWEITETYFKSLIGTVESVLINVTSVRSKLAVETTRVGNLLENIEILLDSMDTIDDDYPTKEQTISTEGLTLLLGTLKKFIERHSRGSVSHRSRREAIITYHGLDVDRMSYVVDAYMNATLKEREAQFWKLPDLSVNADVMSQMYNMAL